MYNPDVEIAKSYRSQRGPVPRDTRRALTGPIYTRRIHHARSRCEYPPTRTLPKTRVQLLYLQFVLRSMPRLATRRPHLFPQFEPRVRAKNSERMETVRVDENHESTNYTVSTAELSRDKRFKPTSANGIHWRIHTLADRRTPGEEV